MEATIRLAAACNDAFLSHAQLFLLELELLLNMKCEFVPSQFVVRVHLLRVSSLPI